MSTPGSPSFLFDTSAESEGLLGEDYGNQGARKSPPRTPQPHCRQESPARSSKMHEEDNCASDDNSFGLTEDNDAHQAMAFLKPESPILFSDSSSEGEQAFAMSSEQEDGGSQSAQDGMPPEYEDDSDDDEDGFVRAVMSNKLGEGDTLVFEYVLQKTPTTSPVPSPQKADGGAGADRSKSMDAVGELPFAWSLNSTAGVRTEVFGSNDHAVAAATACAGTSKGGQQGWCQLCMKVNSVLGLPQQECRRRRQRKQEEQQRRLQADTIARFRVLQKQHGDGRQLYRCQGCSWNREDGDEAGAGKRARAAGAAASGAGGGCGEESGCGSGSTALGDGGGGEESSRRPCVYCLL